MNLSFPTGGCAYGIPWNAANIRPLLDAKKVPCSSPCSMCTVYPCRESAASVVNRLAVAPSNTSLTSIMQTCRSAIGICVYLCDCLEVAVPRCTTPLLYSGNIFFVTGVMYMQTNQEEIILNVVYGTCVVVDAYWQRSGVTSYIHRTVFETQLQ